MVGAKPESALSSQAHYGECDGKDVTLPEVIALIGSTLYGSRWQTDLATSLGISDRTMRRWASGSDIPQFEVADRLMRLIKARQLSLMEVETMLIQSMEAWSKIMPNNPKLPTIRLTQAQVDELNSPWNGSGGFQTLGPKLAAKVEADLTLKLTDAEYGTIVRHMNYAQSGFRDRVRRIFSSEVARLATVPR